MKGPCGSLPEGILSSLQAERLSRRSTRVASS
jgi:hypothetical protein